MTMRFIPSVNPGDLVGNKPTFPVNAQVKGDFLYLRDENGNPISGRTVSDGDEITVLDIGYSKQLVLVQYPTGSGYRQGYVSNATSIIKYKDDYSWVNGSTPEAVYDLDKITQIGTLDPRERAVVLYKVDGMTAVAYDTGKGKLTKSGLVHYEGSGSSTGGGSINGIAPGEVVPGGFTYENNAQVVGDELYLRDANGNRIPGRSVSNGDKITVLDVGYTKQLALVQYPAGSVVRQGYVTNATNLIRYFKQGEWLNGSTTELVLDENGGSLGSLSPYEAATPLYKKNGMTHVVYDTSKGPNTKSGYVKFEGLPELPDTSIQIPSVSHSQATVEVYGTSGKGRPLKVYKIGSGSKVLFAGFALHGWEDNWDNDGLALVNIANALISKIGDYKAQNGLHGWTVYIAPCMNPDGVVVKGTHNGPGRCAVTTRVDMNRCFPYKFSPQYISRNYTGPNPLGAPEAVALKNLVERINSSASEMVVLDFHGWMNFSQGNYEIGRYFGNQFGFGHNNVYSSGFFSSWASTLRNTKATLIEYPTNTYSYNDVINKNYIGKTFNGIINILKNNSNSGDVDTGGNDNSNETFYDAKGEITNVSTTLNVRSGPGTSYTAIGTLRGGDRVSIIAKVKPSSEQLYWYRIKFGSGSGYIRSDFVKLIESGVNEIPMDRVGIIKVSSTLNVRSGPGTIYDIVGTLNNGASVRVVAKVRPLTEEFYWYKIEFGNGIGYVRSDFVSFEHIPNPDVPGNNELVKAKDRAEAIIKKMFGTENRLVLNQFTTIIDGVVKVEVLYGLKYYHNPDAIIKLDIENGEFKSSNPIQQTLIDFIYFLIGKNQYINVYIKELLAEVENGSLGVKINPVTLEMSFVIETKIFEDKEASIKNMFFIEVKFKLNYKELENLFEESFKSVVREIVDFIFNITNIAVQAICIAGLSLIIIYTPFDELGIALVTFLNMLKNSPLPANV
ncbi:TPA: SH3 domain-containing protein [Clostridium perfringens]|jgi:uncharacterized protein YraI|uniref:SH3 domain-containing protein n=1 Tax=Clostridia TaxID=186801 RepID=UPI001CB503B6|nr:MULTISPECIES: SH3 domain-containing protein [Clostridiaceae]EJT5915410.1 SH3 domain-containing protein [Clostridium perfringens]EJT6615247.1 SH3 domain-containing protein [Clostridium perfringens]MBS5954890.1 SH3 domain-containing protein [Paraclostridium bifermentans]MDH5096467.1 Bacteriocin BCN5 [Clostridium perfringens]HBI6990526.1 SH3 domain-containing protein [Clostridium perfringens]